MAIVPRRSVAPVAVHLAHQQHRRSGPEREVVAPGCPTGPEAQLERAVAGDVDRPVVERAQAVRHLDRGVVAPQHLEAQVGGGAAAAGDHVLGVVAQVGVEVQGVRVVQAHLGVRAGRGHEVREVALVGPGQLQRPLDAPGQVVVPLGQVLLGGDVRRAGDDLLGFGHRVRERLGEHLRHLVGTPATGISRQLRRELEARQVVQRHHRLVGAHVAGVRDPPPAVLAARVAVLVERRALDHDAELGRDHGVLEPPGPGGRVAVDVDLRLAGRVHA